MNPTMTMTAGPSLGATPRFDAPYLAWNTVASFDTREEAAAAVDRLARRDFPIEQLDIVGSDVKLVERVTGRLTRGRLARAGAASGVWTGLLIGVLMSLFAPAGAGLAIIASAVLLGAAAGAGFALLARSAAGAAARNTGMAFGEFATARTFVAAHYDLVARNGFADQARATLQDEHIPSFA